MDASPPAAAVTTRFELATPGLTGRCSDQTELRHLEREMPCPAQPPSFPADDARIEGMTFGSPRRPDPRAFPELSHLDSNQDYPGNGRALYR